MSNENPVIVRKGPSLLSRIFSAILMLSVIGLLLIQMGQIAMLQQAVRSLASGNQITISSPEGGDKQPVANLQKSLAENRASIEKLTGKIEALSTPETIAEEESELEPLPIRRANEIAGILEPAAKGDKVDDFAQAIAEVDSWIFAPDEEEAAGAEIERYLVLLRGQLLNEIEELDRKALAASTSEAAFQIYSQGARLLELIPMPRDEAGMGVIRKTLSRREEVNARIRELQRLRYNQWAIGQLDSAFKGYHDGLATVQKWKDDDDLVKAATTSLDKIDPDLLSASTMEVYMSFYRLVSEAISEEHRIKLANNLNDPKTQKKSLRDF